MAAEISESREQLVGMLVGLARALLPWCDEMDAVVGGAAEKTTIDAANIFGSTPPSLLLTADDVNVRKLRAAKIAGALVQKEVTIVGAGSAPTNVHTIKQYVREIGC